VEILKMHTDRSGPVRLEVAVTIDRLGWLDGCPALEALARDTWDRSWYTHEEDGPDMAVRSAAEQALARLGLAARVDGIAADRQPVALLTYLDR
jgi:HEAT repeat protein